MFPEEFVGQSGQLQIVFLYKREMAVSFDTDVGQQLPCMRDFGLSEVLRNTVIVSGVDAGVGGVEVDGDFGEIGERPGW